MERQFYLPKAHNDDQIEIVRKLDAFDQDGAVVQGPPGTGKTHTIANIICHFLATGRRVLVVSHSEGPTERFREQIPEGVRDLTVSILTSEREGIEQLERAVRQIEQVTSSNSPGALAAEIEKQSRTAIECRQKLTAIESRLKQIAQQHLTELGGQPKRAWECRAGCEWCRKARLVARQDFTEVCLWGPGHRQYQGSQEALGSDLSLVKAKLPPLTDLPDPATIASIHADILTLEQLSAELSGGNLPTLAVHEQSGQNRAEVCKRALEAVISALRIVQEVPWLEAYLTGQNEAPSIIESLFEKFPRSLSVV